MYNWLARARRSATAAAPPSVAIRRGMLRQKGGTPRAIEELPTVGRGARPVEKRPLAAPLWAPARTASSQ